MLWGFTHTFSFKLSTNAWRKVLFSFSQVRKPGLRKSKWQSQQLNSSLFGTDVSCSPMLHVIKTTWNLFSLHLHDFYYTRNTSINLEVLMWLFSSHNSIISLLCSPGLPMLHPNVNQNQNRISICVDKLSILPAHWEPWRGIIGSL